MLEIMLYIVFSPLVLICGVFSLAIVIGMVKGIAQLFTKKRK